MFIMTVTIKMLGEESWWSKNQKLREKKSVLKIVDHYCQVSRAYQLLTKKSYFLEYPCSKLKTDKLWGENQQVAIL